MKLLLGIFILVPFLFINYKILRKDIESKIIPNKYLLYLIIILPIWYIYAYYFSYFSQVYLFMFILQMFLTLLVGYLLFLVKVWGAGDAKYLLVLGLYIPHIGIITLVTNIAILTIIYTLISLLWFWFGKNLWSKKSRTQLYTKIGSRLKNAGKGKIDSILGESWINIMLLFIYFIVLFIAFRLIRMYVFTALIQDQSVISFIINFMAEYTVFVGVAIIISLAFAFKGFVHLFYNVTSKYLLVDDRKGKYILIGITMIMLLSYILWAHLSGSGKIGQQLITIFTYYLFIFLFIKAIIVVYKIYIQENYTFQKPVSQLEVGDIIDYSFLIKEYSKDVELGYISKDERNSGKQSGILSPEPKVFFKSLGGGINKKQIKILKKVCKIKNKSTIQMQVVSAFGVYIFCGFALSYLYGNTLILYMTQAIIDMIISFL